MLKAYKDKILVKKLDAEETKSESGIFMKESTNKVTCKVKVVDSGVRGVDTGCVFYVAKSSLNMEVGDYFSINEKDVLAYEGPDGVK